MRDSSPGLYEAPHNSLADVLIVASHAADLLALSTFLGESLEGIYMGMSVRTKVVGVGLAVAGTATARGILATKPRAVLHVGACGVYPNLTNYKPLDVIVPNRIHLVDHAVLQGHGKFAEPMITMVESDPVLSKALGLSGTRVREATIASTLSNTSDDDLAHAVNAATQCEAENCEAFAIGMACKAANVPFCGVLGVTHLVGSTASIDWTQFHRDAIHQVANVVSGWLARGASGLPRAA